MSARWLINYSTEPHIGDWSTRTGVLAKGARTDDGRGDEEGDVMAAGVV